MVSLLGHCDVQSSSLCWFYNLINTPATAPMPTRSPETPHRPAPACMFSKGLPLLFEVLCGGGELVDDAACGCCSAGVDAGAGAPAVGLGDAAADVGESVALGWPSKVDVTVLPKLIVLGPITTGTMICSVCPSSFVVVLVIVDVNTSVN